MTATQYNYNRRNSSTTPYTIPIKVQQQQHANHHLHHHNNPLSPTNSHHMNGSSPITSSSVPTLSREFVVRRISEGETGRLKEELRCEACGKGYKHISSLAKHLWEHTPEWNVTKRLSISKHQQVQLLEAASILVGMNEPTGTPNQPQSQSQSTNGNPNYSDDSPFSPSNSADTNLTNHTTPTPPISDDNKPPTFKNAFDESSEIEDTSSSSHKDFNLRANFNRMGSISQYPPSSTHSPIISAHNNHHNHHQNHPSSPSLNGGYLDHSNGQHHLPPSASSTATTVTHTLDDLKSPSPSYKAVPGSISKSPILVNFTKLNGEVKTEREQAEEDNENAIEDDEGKVNQSFDEEEVVGKMDD
ncbi:C2H2 zinc finger domain-containing protein [Scheffersomyces coipomensis]|uniref:C2H2 zinc finger domain-containing protein n=1 Tax=Scheffersomyces coipomensis TaxID=1788519 RepID=UPI00315CF777